MYEPGLAEADSVRFWPGSVISVEKDTDTFKHSSIEIVKYAVMCILYSVISKSFYIYIVYILFRAICS